jgi:hypothetical protein
MPKLIHQEVMCGYKKCCPTVKEFDDGSVEISDDDAAQGSVGTIKFDPESRDRLLQFLLKKKGQ